MNKNMEKLCAVAKGASISPFPMEDKCALSVVRAVLEELKTLSDESANFGNIINTLMNED